MLTTAENRIAEIPASCFEVSASRGGLEVVDRLADEWRELCGEAADDQPFYRPEWIRAYLRAFVLTPKILLIAARLDGRLRMLLPLLEEKATFNRIPVRRFRVPVNAWAGRFDAVCAAGPDGDGAIRATWRYLKELDGWDLLQLRDSLEGSITGRLAAVARDDGFRTMQIADKPSPYVPTPADPELLKQLPVNSRLRRELRQVRRQLCGQGSLSFYRVDTADPRALGRFYQLEASGWKGKEGGDIISRGARPFFDEIAEAAARFGYFSLYMLELNGQLLAAHFGFTHRRCYYSAIVAYNESFKHLSPGHLIINEIMQDCVARGIRGYDTTGQNQEWKMKWTSQARPLNHHFVFKGPIGRVAFAVGTRLMPVIGRLLGRKAKST
jgi:CelD/BcsL family acetyltransferase involved in cellulose biosynthesis